MSCDIYLGNGNETFSCVCVDQRMPNSPAAYSLIRLCVYVDGVGCESIRLHVSRIAFNADLHTLLIEPILTRIYLLQRLGWTKNVFPGHLRSIRRQFHESRRMNSRIRNVYARCDVAASNAFAHRYPKQQSTHHRRKLFRDVERISYTYIGAHTRNESKVGLNYLIITRHSLVHMSLS
jgi:hypothetical protein